MSLKAKAVSVNKEGEPDGFEAPLCFYPERAPDGATRLVASAPTDQLPAIHAALIRAMNEPLQVLYRQVVNRRDPKPQGSPSRDFVGLGLEFDEVAEAITAARVLLYSDARGELWVRDAMGSQVVLDCDGLLFAYPDDVAFREALSALDIPLERKKTVANCDYVRHEFLAEADALEDGLIETLHLTEVAPQKRTGSKY